MSESFVVEPARPSEQVDAFRLVFRYLPEEEREGRVRNAQSLLERGELEADGLFVARGPRGLLGALLCVPAPGAGGLIWPPQKVPEASPVIENELVSRASHWLRQRGVKLAQALLPPLEAPLAESLLRNGFDHVTTLWYLRHTLELTAGVLAAGEGLSYRAYPRDTETFHQTLLRTYEGTEDCPEVTGARSIDEIITGHQSQGEYDPERWWLALHESQPVGVLLLSRMVEWNGWDVSYVGIVPEARRRGFGRELMRKALIEARVAEATQLTLSVDARNQPAWELYRRLGFEAFEQREVYLAIWKAEAEGRGR